MNDELDENEECDLFLFSRINFDLFLFFLLQRLTISGLDEGEFLFLFLDFCGLFCLLVEEVSEFPDTLFAGLSYELSPALSFSRPGSSLELTTGEIKFASC